MNGQNSRPGRERTNAVEVAWIVVSTLMFLVGVVAMMVARVWADAVEKSAPWLGAIGAVIALAGFLLTAGVWFSKIRRDRHPARDDQSD